MKSQRAQRVGELIQQTVASIIKRHVSDPRLADMSITGVDLAPDLGLAKLFYSVSDESNKVAVAKALAKATGFIRHKMGSSVELRYVPKLRFVYDDVLDNAERLTHLINTIVTDDIPENIETHH